MTPTPHVSYQTDPFPSGSVFTVKNDAILSSEAKTTFQTTRYQIPQDYGTKLIDEVTIFKAPTTPFSSYFYNPS